MPKMVFFVICILLALFIPAVQAVLPAFSNGIHIPPAKNGSTENTSALPADTISACLKQIGITHRFSTFEGKNAVLQAAYEGLRPKVISENLPTQLTQTDTFGTAFSEDNASIFVAAFTSVDACAMRIQVDRAQAVPGEELYIIDPQTLRAFGPYIGTSSKWLVTTSGDTAIVVARVPFGSRPGSVVTTLSHFFVDLNQLTQSSEKVFSCEINIACETDDTIQELSAGVGMIIVPYGQNMLFGTGSLIDVPSTEAYEPYFITANHLCSTSYQAQNAQVYWDYRSTVCGTDTTTGYTTLPTSDGVALLSTDSTLDATLIQLDSVPVGSYGRTYLGWDTRSPVAGESILVMHHPEGTPMRISHGNVTGLDKTVQMEDLNGTIVTYQHETKVGYSLGITESGSSGSALLYDDGTYRIAGTLSGGNSAARCGAGASVNYDFYSSFRNFYDSIESYLSATADPSISLVSPTSVTATTPTLLTITGTNFKTTGTTYVTFTGASPMGTLSVIANVSSATTLTVTTPSVAYTSSKTVTVQITNPDDTVSNTASIIYKVDSSSSGITCHAGPYHKMNGSTGTLTGDLLILMMAIAIMGRMVHFRKKI